MQNDRRSFLKQVSGAAAAVVAASKLTEEPAQAAELVDGPIDVVKFDNLRLAGNGVEIKYALELDGSFAGWLANAEGGNATSDVVVEKQGADGIARKHLAGVKYEDITVNCGTGMSKAFYDWLKMSFDHKHSRKNGSVITADYKYNTLSVLTFANALITEIGFPALDADSKEPAYMTLKFAPEITRRSGASKVSLPAVQKTQKAFLPSNFRLTIDGVEQDSSRVSKIDALTVKQKVTENPVGELRDYEQEPASLEIPNLVITLPESHSEEFYKWHEDFVIKGNNSQDKEKTGALEYLTEDLKATLFTLNFSNLGIFKCAEHKIESGGVSTRQVKAEMYCEELKFEYLG